MPTFNFALTPLFSLSEGSVQWDYYVFTNTASHWGVFTKPISFLKITKVCITQRTIVSSKKKKEIGSQISITREIIRQRKGKFWVSDHFLFKTGFQGKVQKVDGK